ncbi:potassium channel family protein [Intestinibacillus sp. Marseille-P6563]|uniref:potassium channel family protein n=1 Tax=Intestinibacillus sp. Marseille-P6563 TaxID=2364792 RepID=UPI000F04E685|nr:TrkA family potassium uptake protein [Intestinibacillus sp. Marseille-P6563]
MKSILLIGLGRFGKHVALKLNELRHEVLAIDKDEDRVNEVLPYVTSAQIGDSTNEQFIASLGVRNFDLCIVAIGDNFQSSLETASLLKDYGASLVVARANRDVHAKFLLRNGADHVIYPERQVASWAAVRFSADNVFDYVQLTNDYSIYETPLPRDWVGKTIINLRVRQEHKINILAVKYQGRLEPLPGPEHVFRADETLLVMGSNKDLARFLRL